MKENSSLVWINAAPTTLRKPNTFQAKLDVYLIGTPYIALNTLLFLMMHQLLAVKYTAKFSNIISYTCHLSHKEEQRNTTTYMFPD